MEGFVYVVNPPEIPRVAFGTSLHRETLPLSGPNLSSFMRKHQGDVFISPGPTARCDTRNLMEIKYPSRFGYSAFASKILRLPPTEISAYPCVGTYDVDIKRSKKPAYKPFNVGGDRSQPVKFLTPGPNTYAHHLPPRRLQITTAFGKMRKVTPVVKVFCSPFNVSLCHKCEQRPNGDYWHNFEDNLDLCRGCMNKIKRQLKSCSTNEVIRLRLYRQILRYQLVRYCGFYHNHHGVNAAIQELPSKTLKNKIKIENYLSLYM